jgi:hypothetical protein
MNRNEIRETLRRQVLGLLVAGMIGATIACGGKSNSPTTPSNTSTSSNIPQITSCNTVVYRGITYADMGCRVGIASFTSTLSIGGSPPVCFNVTCSAGCVSAVRIC